MTSKAPLILALLFASVANAQGVRTPTGVFALLPGNGALPKPAVIAKAAGVTIRVPWREFEPQRGVYDYAQFNAGFKLAGNRPVKLLLMTGKDNDPPWIGGTWIVENKKKVAPLPWSPELRAAYAEAVEALGRTYGNSTQVVGVHITGPTWPSAELHPPPGIEKVKGYSDSLMAGAWQSSIDAYAAAFPNTTCLLSISVQQPANRYVHPVCDYAMAKLGKRFGIEHNSLKAGTLKTAPHHKLVTEYHAKGVPVWFEMVCAASNDPGRFGSRDVNVGLAIGRAAGMLGADVYPPDLGAVR